MLTNLNNKYQMIDSHAHVAFSQFDEDRDLIVKNAREAGVGGWIEVGTDLEQSKKANELARLHNNVWSTVGVHPGDVMKMTEDTWRALEDLQKELAI